MKPKFLAFSLLILLCFTRYTEGGLEISGNIGYCSGKHKFFNHESFQTLGLSFTLRSKLRSQVEIGFFYYPNYFGSSVSSLGNKRTSSAWNLNVSYLY